ncbi:MAG: trimethylamine methyltransferase family protein [Chloroflexi bacterium]|jgi:trimethylamine--corrinoid protein Co-methyltransferase|nr:trimethylamine methyltransferase family protein [Chloroflexota bacterium]
MSDSSGRRRERRARQDAARQVAMQPISYRPPPFDLLSPGEIERLHQAALRILGEYGIDFYDDEMLAVLRAHGIAVSGSTARFSPAQIEQYVALAPAQFVQRARNPANNVVIGGDQMVFAPVYGPPFVQDLAGGRREATIADFENFVKLAYLSPHIHHSGGTIVEPTDEPVATRHLDMLYRHIRFSDKAFMGSVTSGENAADSVALAELVFGAAAIREQPALLSLINVSSPRRYDERMLAALKVYARARQALVITPFILAGAMGPASIAGTLAQQHAEALAGIALTQMIEPGTPVVYGSFLTNIDLQSGAPVFGSPESQIGLYASAQLARRQRLPFRGGGMFSSSKLPDAQAGYESIMVMQPTLLARTNFVLHAAGWLENGLVAGYEKFVLDCEILGMLHVWARGIDCSDEALAFDAHDEVPPGGHYLGTAHTLRHFRDAFYRAELFDYTSAEQWQLNGAQDSFARAAHKVRALLDSYQLPPIDPAIDAAVCGWIARRRAEIGQRPQEF